MFPTLSTDISLAILSYLPVHDVLALHTLSRTVQHFLNDHEHEIFHQLAVVHRFAPSGVSLEEAVKEQASFGGYHLRGVGSWKEYCRESAILERNWTGRGFVVEGSYDFGHGVLRFEINEEKALVLATSTDHTLTVYNMRDMRRVWSLSNVYDFRHSGRFLVLWRSPERRAVEIWRLLEDTEPSNTSPAPLPSFSPLAPTASQLTESANALETSTGSVGRYAALGFLPAEHNMWWYPTLCDPYLAVVSPSQGHVVRVYDLARGALHQLVDLDPILVPVLPSEHTYPSVFAMLMEVQLSKRYVFVGFDSAAVIVELRGGLNTHVTEGPNKSAVAYTDGEDAFAVHKGALQCSEVDAGGARDASIPSYVTTPAFVGAHAALLTGADAFTEFLVVPATTEQLAREEDLSDSVPELRRRRNNPSYIAASFSPDGHHLIVGTAFGVIYLFPLIDRLFVGGVGPEEIVQKMYAGGPIVRMRWMGSGDRMVAFQDDEHQLSLLDLNPNVHCPGSDSDDTQPRLKGARLLRLRRLTSAHESPRGDIHLRKTGLWAAAPRSVAEADTSASQSQPRGCAVRFVTFTAKSDIM